ncbi:MAG TPA: uroporphyrinogen decarboxylase family protein [Methanomassiliicoccales archaeon]|nr:uroporphyrinogen decarboxylase family protein [Methanomassiliicoccales archaeon]
MKEMTSMQRFEAALKHETPDYVPVSYFSGIYMLHWMKDQLTWKDTVEYGRNGIRMANTTIKFLDDVGGDTAYILSDVGEIVQGWGVRMKIADEPDIHMALGKFAVNEPGDWEKLDVLDPLIDGRMPTYLDACEVLRDKYHDKVPIGVDVPSALTTCTHVAPMETVLIHMLTEPDALKKGLKTVTKTVGDFLNACANEGAYYAAYLTTRASKEITTLEQYQEFGVPTDKEIFKNTPGLMHICHVCGVEPMFEIISDYARTTKNVKGISWWDRGAKPNLTEAKQKWGKDLCLMAGIDHTNTLTTGTIQDIEKEVEESCKIAMPGSGFIFAPGCDISPKTPKENMRAMVKAARKHGKYR